MVFDNSALKDNLVLGRLRSRDIGHPIKGPQYQMNDTLLRAGPTG